MDYTRTPAYVATFPGSAWRLAASFDSMIEGTITSDPMASLRRVLTPLTAVLLICQAGTVALAPVALSVTASDPHAAACECGHGPGAMCPMHHKPGGRPEGCAMQAASSPAAAVLTILSGTTGLLTERTYSIPAPVTTALPQTADVHFAGERPVPPDPPPPRA